MLKISVQENSGAMLICLALLTLVLGLVVRAAHFIAHDLRPSKRVINAAKLKSAKATAAVAAAVALIGAASKVAPEGSRPFDAAIAIETIEHAQNIGEPNVTSQTLRANVTSQK